MKITIEIDNNSIHETCIMHVCEVDSDHIEIIKDIARIVKIYDRNLMDKE